MYYLTEYNKNLKSGPDRSRTDNLLYATQALCQLSYGPNSGGHTRDRT